MPSDKKALALSIIIPAYNEQNHIRACLESIARQTQMPDQVIVVNNNSSDDTVKIAKEFDFVTVLNEKTQGIIYARDRGFDSASGDIFGRIDSDTVLPADWVSRVMKFYASPKHQKCALTGGGYFYNIRMKHFNGWMLSQLAYRMNKIVIGHHILWGSNMALPKQAWLDVKPDVCVDNKMHEDMDIAIHLNRIGYKISYRPKLKVGVKLKRVFSNRPGLREHMDRWPYTLHMHSYSRWWLGSVGNLILWYFARPVIYMSEYFNRHILKRQPFED